MGQRGSFPLFYLDSYAQNVRFDNSFGREIFAGKIVHVNVNAEKPR